MARSSTYLPMSVLMVLCLLVSNACISHARIVSSHATERHSPKLSLHKLLLESMMQSSSHGEDENNTRAEIESETKLEVKETDDGQWRRQGPKMFRSFLQSKSSTQ